MKVVHIEETSTVAKAEMGFWQHVCGKKSLTKFDLLLNGVQKHTINPPSTGWGQRTKVRVPPLIIYRMPSLVMPLAITQTIRQSMGTSS
jgi:hypothetical protein